MGLSTTTVRRTYTGDGSTVSFSFPLYFFNQVDLLVYVWDTLAGGITAKILNVDYTISGTPNASGFYPNGASIVFGTAPATTDVVQIVNSPDLTQAYALLQNGNINSTALVQQFDKIAMQVQRLQDQLNRAIMLEDGTYQGDFSGKLPANTPLDVNANEYVKMNQNADGFTYDNANPQVSSITLSYADLQTAAMTNNIELFDLPASAMLTSVFIKHNTAFAGGAIATMTASVGIATDYQRFIDQFNIAQAVSDSNYDSIMANYLGSWANATTIYLQAVSTGANLSALTSGSVTIYYSYTTLL